VQHLREETHVEQVQDGVLDAADILLNRHPTRHILGPERSTGEARAAIAVEIPGAVDEGVHGVGIALGVRAALRAGHIAPGRRSITGQRRGALRCQIRTTQMGQLDR